MRQGRFREDLFYRLNVISLNCPSLRERREDVFELALHFLRLYSGQAGKQINRIEEEALEALASFSWPGNIRQLENAIERAVVLADGESIGPADLPPEIRDREYSDPKDPAWPGFESAAGTNRTTSPPVSIGNSRAGAGTTRELSHDVEALERSLVHEALEQCRGNKAQAARLLGIPRSTLFSKLRRLGIE
jgi:DNA-binding NtrC family response regulator